MAQFVLNGIQCLDPRETYKVCRDARIDSSEWEGKANFFEMKVGVDPSEGLVLCHPLSVTNSPTGLAILCATSNPTSNLIAGSRSQLLLPGIGIEWTKQIFPSSSSNTGAYLVHLTDKRQDFIHTIVGERYNLVERYDYENHKFIFDSATALSPTVPYGWQAVFAIVAAKSGFSFTSFPSFPEYYPLDLDFRYATVRDALQLLCEWSSTVIVPEASGGFSLQVYDKDSTVYSDKHNELSSCYSWDDHVSLGNLGRVTPASFNLYFKQLTPVNPDVSQYSVVNKIPTTSPKGTHLVSLRIPNYAIDDSLMGTFQKYENSAAEWTNRTEEMLGLYPPKIRRYSFFHNVSVSSSICQVCWKYTLDEAPSTYLQNVLLPEWLAKPKEVESSSPPQSATIVRFQLLEDKTVDDLVVLAQPITEDGVPYGEQIAVNDPDLKFQGYASYLDESSGVIQPGYRGYAVYVQEQYSILILEGMARFVEGVATENFSNGAWGRAEVANWWGAYPNDRAPIVELVQYGGSNSQDPLVNKFVIEFTDPAGLAQNSPIQEGDSIYLLWDEFYRHYILLTAGKTSTITRVKGTTTQTITKETTVSRLTNVVGLDQPGQLPDIDFTILPNLRMDIPNSGQELYLSRNVTLSDNWHEQWDNADMANHYWILRGHTGWDGAKKQVFVSYGSSYPEMKWVEMDEDYQLGSLKEVNLSWPGASSIKVEVVANQIRAMRIKSDSPANFPQAVSATLAGKTCNG